MLVLAGGCNLPLIMLEIEAPEVCVTNVVDIDATDMAAGVSGTDELPSEMAAKLAAALGTEITIEDNLVELPEEARDLLDLDVQIKLVRITALSPHADALDLANELLIRVRPPAGSGLEPKDLLAFTRAPGAPSGTPIEATGQELNLAEYLYSGQLTFDYAIDATVVVAEPWQAEVTTCIKTRGYVDASIDDALSL
jgi:hypothetical protein